MVEVVEVVGKVVDKELVISVELTVDVEVVVAVVKVVESMYKIVQNQFLHGKI